MAVALVSLDLRRKSFIADGKPADHAQDILARRSASFDLDKTIFKTLDSALTRIVQKDRLNIEVFWSDAAAHRILGRFASIPAALPHDQPILEFMQNDCSFVTEHADGSFMDHLQFCYEYSAAHFCGHSPRVMFLHSIMGVGTNYFPMDVTLIPKLQTLVTEAEMSHIEAFPSVLRLLLHGPLVQELTYAPNLSELRRVKFHRVIDNFELSMDADAFWIQLNYQLVHLLDFLPVANWCDHQDNTFLVPFAALHAILVQSDRLLAHVDFDLTPAERSPDAAPPMTLGGFIVTMLPSRVKRAIARKSIAKFSAAISHSLSYTIEWDARCRL